VPRQYRRDEAIGPLKTLLRPAHRLQQSRLPKLLLAQRLHLPRQSKQGLPCQVLALNQGAGDLAK
jgi:hypothetical protein